MKLSEVAKSTEAQRRRDLKGGAAEAAVGTGAVAAGIAHKPIIAAAHRVNEKIYEHKTRDWVAPKGSKHAKVPYGMDERGRPVDKLPPPDFSRQVKDPKNQAVLNAERVKVRTAYRAAKEERKVARRRLSGYLNTQAATKHKVSRALNRPARYTLISTGIFAGAPMAWHGAHRVARSQDAKVTKRETSRTKDVDRAAVGAGVGVAAYEAAGFAPKPTYEKLLRQRIRTGGDDKVKATLRHALSPSSSLTAEQRLDNKLAQTAGRSAPHQTKAPAGGVRGRIVRRLGGPDEDKAEAYRKVEREHAKRSNLTGNEKLGDPKYVKFYRTYPKALPGSRYRRVLSYTHGGKTQVAGAGVTASALAIANVRRGRNKDRQQVEKGAMGEYPYLLPNIREAQVGIPEARRNPLSPMAMLAGANIAGEGYLKVNSKWPFGRRKRTLAGVNQIAAGAQMGIQPVGYGVISL